MLSVEYTDTPGLVISLNMTSFYALLSIFRHPSRTLSPPKAQNQTVTMTMTNVDVYSDDEEEPCMSWSRQKSDSSLMGDVHLNSMTLPAGNGSLAVGSIGGMGGADVLFVENASGGLVRLVYINIDIAFVVDEGSYWRDDGGNEEGDRGQSRLS